MPNVKPFLLRSSGLFAAVAAVAACAALSACLDAPETPTAPDPSVAVPTETPVPDETVFTETDVHLDADGQLVASEPRAITAGEERAQNAVKEALSHGDVAAISQDVGCGSGSFWLYARTDWTGDRICFWGQGGADLRDYVRLRLGIDGHYHIAGTWELPSGSFWAGSDVSELFYFGGPGVIFSALHFPAYAKQAFVTPDGAYLLELGSS
jgi:hypothetical protein